MSELRSRDGVDRTDPPDRRMTRADAPSGGARREQVPGLGRGGTVGRGRRPANAAGREDRRRGVDRRRADAAAERRSDPALVREREAFPGGDTPVAVVVYARDSGITPDDRSAVEADRVAFARLSADDELGPVVPSEDGRALLLSFPIAGDIEAAEAVVAEITSELADAPAGLDTAVTGSAGAARRRLRGRRGELTPRCCSRRPAWSRCCCWSRTAVRSCGSCRWWSVGPRQPARHRGRVPVGPGTATSP